MKKVLVILGILVLFAGIGVGAYFFYFKPKMAELLAEDPLVSDIYETYQEYQGEDLEEPEEGITFLFVSDSQRSEGNINHVIKNFVKETNASGADFVVHGGDFTTRGKPAEYKEFKDFWTKNLKLPYYMVPGNHDILQDETSRKIFQDNFGKLYDSWEMILNEEGDQALFIYLDNSFGSEGFNETQLAWLESTLAENQDTPAYIFTHRPVLIPFQGLFSMRDEETKAAHASYEKFDQLLAKYPVEEIFCGHVHTYFVYSLPESGTPVTISGGGGSESNLPLPEAEDYYHYLRVNVTPEGHKTEVVEIEGMAISTNDNQI